MRGGVFICYRREDSAGFAGRIYDRLKHSLGRWSTARSCRRPATFQKRSRT